MRKASRMEGWIEPPARVSDDPDAVDSSSDFVRSGIVELDEDDEGVEEEEDEKEGAVNPWIQIQLPGNDTP